VAKNFEEAKEELEPLARKFHWPEESDVVDSFMQTVYRKFI
jgi:hypothetical protein